MRAKASAVHAPDGAIDIVGTGGDGKGTLNLSTATAFVVAGAGIPVAKHGNRAVSSKAGAADVLSALGVNVFVDAKVVEEELEVAGIGFMMAPMHHASMRHVGPTRIELATRTIFNLLGPLTNPAGVRRQLTGVYDPILCRPLAEALRGLGSEYAWLVHGADGSDEVSISGATHVAALQDGDVREFEITPADAGLPEHPPAAIAGGTAEENAAHIRHLLAGEASGFRDAVLLNAAAALLVARRVDNLKEGAGLAATSIDGGHAARALDKIIEVSSRHAS